MPQTIEKYVYSLGMLLSDVKIDHKGRLVILIEDSGPRAGEFYREIEIPEEYQTFANIEVIRQFQESIITNKCLDCGKDSSTAYCVECQKKIDEATED